MRVYLESLGCRLNAAEIIELAGSFAGAGHVVVEALDAADVILLNTCAVTAQAARKSRHRLRMLHRRNPRARLAALGCWVNYSPEEAAGISGVTCALPNADKPRAVELLTGQAVEPVPWEPGQGGYTRVFLGVQTGCDNACTYCITRILRGAARSRSPAAVVTQVQSLVARGAQEVVLTGVSLGAYGHDLGLESGLAALVAAILQDTDLPRLRLSSVEPWDVDEQLLRCWESPRLCRQLHLPLQAGSDAVLRRMGRRITTAQFTRLVERARAISPDLALTTDIITGFPGESESDFAEGLAFVAAQHFARLHVFPYSERAGTPALQLSGSVPVRARRARAARMRDLGARLAAAYRRRFLGRVLPVLWERRNAAGHWRGLSDNYLGVVTYSPEELYNRITPTRLVSMEGEQLRGEPQLRAGHW